MKKCLTYVFLGVGFFICTCLSLLIFNVIGIGNFENIIGDAFPIALSAGAMMILMLKLFKNKTTE